MKVRELKIPGAWEVSPEQYTDSRGTFLEWFKADAFTAIAPRPLDVQQANLSVSAAGVVRGIHFADVPPGQAKYVTCAVGAVVDVIVDIRTGSATFGQWDAVVLDDIERRAVYLSEGLGHAFMSLEDNSTVLYLCSSPYAPEREHGINPFDPELAITWPTSGRDGTALTPSLSDKDRAAPSLAQARAAGILPTMDAVATYLAW